MELRGRVGELIETDWLAFKTDPFMLPQWHRLNVELDLYLGSCVRLYSLAEAPQLPPQAYIRGRYWPAKIKKQLALCNPLPNGIS